MIIKILIKIIIVIIMIIIIIHFLNESYCHIIIIDISYMTIIIMIIKKL